MKEILFRLEMLKNAQLITSKDIDDIVKLLEYLNEEYEIEINEENTSMLVTHIAMLKNRINKEEVVVKLDDESINELYEYKELEKAKLILKYFEKNILKSNIHEYERPYIYTHLITILGGK